ncbi:ATP-binding cassette, subfamily C (CFTR/MRP), member 3 [Fusarium oxysporum f. sp. vasinfectum 25433]|uniref:ATP-binding cassette, subfamily C (CFTR/MRP), member 3 n=1 Tax=Fusarium oxysporum f. sp. vasinfectum 25433 TaxID=1089449 RepID=X0NF44_FUSOX|nr:ATP-binding cassette, subfamily C (CFTR/MRP), member 3 [Fusarium oxysporum f. sp. vasinfectum 25433]
MASSDVVWLNIWPLPTIMSSLFSAAISKTSDVLSCSPRMRTKSRGLPFRSSTNSLGPEISGLFTSQPTFTCLFVQLLTCCLAGSNLSQGQRQLVSLARAMLTPSNILVLDEATAAVDVETDAMLQSTLRSPLFANRTIITVAHRLNTILDSDRVVVLDKGEVVEFDSPAELFKKQGVFYGLMKQAGLEVE